MNEDRQLSIHRQRRMQLAGAQGRAKRVLIPTRKHPLIISASELRDFLRCRVKWSWRHQLRILPKERSEALSIGTLADVMLSDWYNLTESERTTKAMRRIARHHLHHTNPDKLSQQNLELVQAMCVGYAAWIRPRDREIKMRDAKSQVFFEQPLTKDGSILVRGFIDVEFRPASLRKTMGLVEHKTKAQIKTDIIDLNTQLSVYLWAMRKRHKTYKRFVAYYRVLRKQMPGPRVKADLFASESVERTDDEIHQWEIDTRRACEDILDGAIYPNPQDSCSWECDYQLPCLMRSNPGDLAAILRRDFLNKDGSEVT